MIRMSTSFCIQKDYYQRSSLNIFRIMQNNGSPFDDLDIYYQGRCAE